MKCRGYVPYNTECLDTYLDRGRRGRVLEANRRREERDGLGAADHVGPEGARREAEHRRPRRQTKMAIVGVDDASLLAVEVAGNDAREVGARGAWVTRVHSQDLPGREEE